MKMSDRASWIVGLSIFAVGVALASYALVFR